MSNNNYDADAAIARHYARQQEGLPPLPPPKHPGWSLFPPHRAWLRKYFPVPRSMDLCIHPIPTFEWFLEHEWPALSATAAPGSVPASTASAPPDPPSE